MEIGLAFLPVAVVMGLFSIRFSALLINRFGPFAVLVSGQVVIVAALAVLGFGPTSANYAINLMVPLALLGLGGGLSFPFGSSASTLDRNRIASNTGTIFGEDLISDKSLDEVILSYLAEDLEGEKK